MLERPSWASTAEAGSAIRENPVMTWIHELVGVTGQSGSVHGDVLIIAVEGDTDSRAEKAQSLNPKGRGVVKSICESSIVTPFIDTARQRCSQRFQRTFCGVVWITRSCRKSKSNLGTKFGV